jgi:hypothetical protein
MNADAARAVIENVLAMPATDKWFPAHVPHGFEVDEIYAEHSHIKVGLTVPVIFEPEPYVIPLRASSTTTSDNLDALRWYLEHTADSAGVRLRGWSVAPDEIPPPYTPAGKPNGPPPDWHVTVDFDV